MADAHLQRDPLHKLLEYYRKTVHMLGVKRHLLTRGSTHYAPASPHSHASQASTQHAGQAGSHMQESLKAWHAAWSEGGKVGDGASARRGLGFRV